MAIEIKQLVIKSNVLQRQGSTGDGGGSNPEDTKHQDILDEVRRMIAQALRQTKER